jgi:hypothetical protein
VTALLDIRVLTALAVAVGVVAVFAVGRPALLLPGAIALGVLLTRPSAIGERIPVLGPVVLVAAAGACLLRALRERSVDRGPFPWPFLLMALAWVWLGLHALFAPGSEPNLGTSTITVFLPVMALYLVVRDPELLARVRTVLVGLVVGISALVVVALVVIAIVGPTATLVGTVPLGYLGSDAGVYLPGALSYGLDPAAAFPRMLTVGREPGMGALVLGWAFFAMPATFPRPRISQAVLVIAILGTQSTAGVGILGVCIVLRAVLGRARFSPWAATVAIVGGAATVWLAAFSTQFGLITKIDAPGGSFAARNQVTLDGLRALVSHPFTTQTTAPVSSTNLVAAIAVDGAPWALLMVAFLAAPMLRARRRDPLRYGSLFVLLTMLTSQPLAGNAGILLLAVIAFYAADRAPATAPSPAPPPPSPPPPPSVANERPVRGFYAYERPVRSAAAEPSRPAEAVG